MRELLEQRGDHGEEDADNDGDDEDLAEDSGVAGELFGCGCGGAGGVAGAAGAAGIIEAKSGILSFGTRFSARNWKPSPGLSFPYLASREARSSEEGLIPALAPCCGSKGMTRTLGRSCPYLASSAARSCLESGSGGRNAAGNGGMPRPTIGPLGRRLPYLA